MAFASGATLALAATRGPNRFRYATSYNSFWANHCSYLDRHPEESATLPELRSLPRPSSPTPNSFTKQVHFFCQRNWVSVALATVILGVLGGLFLYHLLFGNVASSSLHPPIVMGALALIICIPVLLCRLLIRSHFRELDLQAQHRMHTMAVDSSTQTQQGSAASNQTSSRRSNNGRVYACIIIAPDDRANPPSYDDAVRCAVPPNAVAPLSCSGCPFECEHCEVHNDDNDNERIHTPPPSYGEALDLLANKNQNAENCRK